MSFDIREIIKKLSSKRPIFYSESDFQFALAWEIKINFEKFNIRLEKREKIDNTNMYFDIFAWGDEKKIAIELKYKTKKIYYSYKNEQFELKEQSAQDQGGYDFFKDISRLKRAVSNSIIDIGFAIFLTNDQYYWDKPKRQNVNDIDFRIYDGRCIHKNTELKWNKNASEGTKKNRENSIVLNGAYKLCWEDYSKINNQQFKYLLVEISGS